MLYCDKLFRMAEGEALRVAKLSYPRHMKKERREMFQKVLHKKYFDYTRPPNGVIDGKVRK